MSTNDAYYDSSDLLDKYNLQDPDYYHNLAVNVVQSSSPSEAFEIVAAGLARFSNDIDLLADAVRWAPLDVELKDRPSPESGGALVTAEDFYKKLLEAMDRWNWRAYDFCIDYLVDRRAPTETDVEAMETLQEALTLAEKFTEAFPIDERSYSAKAKVLCALHRDDEAKQLLDKVVVQNWENGKGFPCSQCCLRLADMLMEEGDFETVIKVTEIGLIGTASPQPTANSSYLIFLKTLSEDALLILRYIGKNFDASFTTEAYRLIVTYQMLINDQHAKFNQTYAETATSRILILRCLAGILGNDGANLSPKAKTTD